MIRLVLVSLMIVGLSGGHRSFAQSNPANTFIEEEIVLNTSTGDLSGSLIIPVQSSENSLPLVLLISGSGPTDRDGANPAMPNKNLKKLAEGLGQNQIASLRFDKRGIAKSTAAAVQESDLRFDQYVNDVKDWVGLLSKDKRFNKIIIVGHSEGALIGAIAAAQLPAQVSSLVSIAGAGRAADEVIKEQLKSQPQAVIDLCYPILDSLKKGVLVPEVNPMLFSLFRPSVQPYMISWFQFDPQEAIKNVKVPILILQGQKDIQVSVEDATLLKTAQPAAKLIVLDNVNHLLVNIPGDLSENQASYRNPDLPLDARIVKEIVGFINN